MMKLLNFILLTAVFIPIACTKPKSGDIQHSQQHNVVIDGLMKKLKPIPVGYNYNLVLQDGEDCYQTNSKDTLFFPEYTYVVGYLPDTSRFYSVVYLEAGDDLYPAVKIFAKTGVVLSFETVAYADCAAGGCEVDSCVSMLKIVDATTMERSIAMKVNKCDSSASKIHTRPTRVLKRQIVKIEVSGKLYFDTEKTE